MKTSGILRFAVISIFLLGLSLHTWFAFRAGEHFSIIFPLGLAMDCLPYAVPAIAAYFLWRNLPLILLITIQITLLAFDLCHARDWSLGTVDAAFGNAIVWMGQIAFSSFASMIVIALNGFQKAAEE